MANKDFVQVVKKRADEAAATTEAAPVVTGTSDGSVKTGGDGIPYVDILIKDDEFVPNEVTIAGAIMFHIRSDNMSVATSSIDKPCQPGSGGIQFWSTEKLSEGSVFRVSNVTADDTILIYNPDAKNCADGFVGIINPKGDLTLSAWEDAAKAYDADGVAPSDISPFGGSVGTVSSVTNEPFYQKHLGVIIACIAAIAMIIVAFGAWFCVKSKRKLARQREAAMYAQQQEMYDQQQQQQGGEYEEEEMYEQEQGKQGYR